MTIYWKPTIKSIGGKTRRDWEKSEKLVLSGTNKNNAHAIGRDVLKINKLLSDLKLLPISRKRQLYRAKFLRRVQRSLILIQLSELASEIDVKNVKLEVIKRGPSASIDEWPAL